MAPLLSKRPAVDEKREAIVDRFLWLWDEHLNEPAKVGILRALMTLGGIPEIEGIVRAMECIAGYPDDPPALHISRE